MIKILINKKINNKIKNIALKDDVLFFQKKELKLCIKNLNKKNFNKLLIINNIGDYSFLYKKNSNWNSFEKINIERYIFNKMNIFPKTQETNLKKIFKTKNSISSKKISYKNGKIFFNDNIFFEKYINFLINEIKSDNFVKNIINFIEKNKSVLTEKIKLPQLNEYNFKKVLNIFKNELKIKGYKYKLIFSNENKTIFKVGDVFHEIIIENENVIILSEVISESRKECYYEYKNSISFLKKLLFKNRPINKEKLTKQIIYASLGFLIFLSLIWFTFSFVFSFGTISDSFNTLGNPDVWKEPWPYLLVFNFIIDFFWSWFITIIISLTLTKNKKIDFSMMLNALQAGSIRVIVKTITGNSFLGTFAWGWFMSNSRDIRPAKIVGGIAVVGLIRSVLFFLIAIPFIISGTIFSFNNMDNFGLYGNQNSAFIAFIVLSWTGFFWAIIHDGMLAFIILVPFSRIIYVRIKNYKFIDKNNFESKIINTEMSIEQFSSTYKNIFKDKKRIVRIILMITGGIFLEAFELTYVLNMVETSTLPDYIDGVKTESVTYWNIFQISGVRLMSSYAHHTPILNILPGNGIGIVEPLLNNSIFAIIMSKHNWDINNSSEVYVASNMAMQAGFITRFFNSYLPTIIRSFISIFAFINISIKIKKTL